MITPGHVAACIRKAGHDPSDCPQWAIDAIVNAYQYGYAIGEWKAAGNALRAIAIQDERAGEQLDAAMEQLK